MKVTPQGTQSGQWNTHLPPELEGWLLDPQMSPKEGKGQGREGTETLGLPHLLLARERVPELAWGHLSPRAQRAVPCRYPRKSSE